MLRSIFIKCSSASSNQILCNKKKGLVFVVVVLVGTFYTTLHAFQVSTQIDFLITQTILPTTKNGFDMTKENLTALITETF